MNQYRIEGGHPLKGRIRVSGNKNAALPCIAAALLAEEPVTLRNVPEIEDVFVMLDICRALGAGVERLGADAWTIDGRGVGQPEVPVGLAARVRASILFAGPLLARFGKVTLAT